jgi:predicted RNA methylase|eukprot:g3743.t1
MSSPGNPDIEHLEIYCLLLHVSKKIGKQLVLDQAGNSKDETVSMGMAARFAALRRKIEASVTPYSKVRGVERTAGAVRFCTIDKMGKAVGSRSAQRKQNGKKRKRQHDHFPDILLASEHEIGVPMKTYVDSVWNQLRQNSRLPFFALLPFSFVQAHEKLNNFFSASGAICVLPVRSEVLSGPCGSEFLWVCGGWGSKQFRNDAINRVISDQMSRRQDDLPVAKVFKSWKLAVDHFKGSGGRLKHLFPKISPEIRSKLKLDATAMFSVTDEVSADQMTKIILKNNFVKGTAIVDATACVGGNLLSFSKALKHCVGIEIDEGRYRMLSHNMNLLRKTRKGKVEVHREDCVSFISKGSNPVLQKPHVVFFDPPWGGLNYKSNANSKLFLGSKPIEDVVETCFSNQKCAFVALKAPFNFDVRALDMVKNCKVATKSISKRVKLHLINRA